MEKLNAMTRLFSPADIATMRKVKQVFDPDNRLNPGKLIPPEPEEASPAKESIPVKGKAAPKEREALYQRLAEIVGTENVLTDKKATTAYEVDGIVPGAVVFASSTEQVSQIIKAANESGTSVIPWGSGSKQQVVPCPQTLLPSCPAFYGDINHWWGTGCQCQRTVAVYVWDCP